MSQNYSASILHFQQAGETPITTATDEATTTVGNLANNETLVFDCMIQNVSDPNAAAQNLTDQLQSLHAELVGIENSSLEFVNNNVTNMLTLLNTFDANVNTVVNDVNNLFAAITALPGQLTLVADSLKNTILNSIIPQAINEAHSYATGITSTIINFTNCKVLADDWLALVYSACKQTK